MNTQQFKSKLENMKGKSYMYANKVHFIKGSLLDEVKEKFEIITDRENFNRKLESFDEFLTYWTEMVPANAAALTLSNENTLANDLVTILKDNIDKVKADAKYIPQAQAVNASVSNILGIQKVKIELMRELRSAKPSNHAKN